MNLTAACGLAAGTAFLFYRSVWGLIPGLIPAIMFMRNRRRRWEAERTGSLKRQFISGMEMVSGSLQAGYSMENAWRRAEGEVAQLFGKNSEFAAEMKVMNQRVAMNEPLEKVLSDFADSTGVEDICRFAEVYSYAKRSGGDLNRIIRSVTERMQMMAEVMTEIETTLASKKMEQSMMNILLPGILLFITVSSPSYVSALYHNILGILVMSASLGGYLGCMFWSEKLMDIPV